MIWLDHDDIPIVSIKRRPLLNLWRWLLFAKGECPDGRETRELFGHIDALTAENREAGEIVRALAECYGNVDTLANLHLRAHKWVEQRDGKAGA